MSRRSRANRSLGTKINNIDSRISAEEKAAYVPLNANTISNLQLSANSVNSDSVNANAVNDEGLDSGAVVTNSLGIVNRLQSSYHLDLVLGDGGNIRLDGDQYPPPVTGSVAPLTLDSTGKVVLGTGASTGDGSSTVDWANILSKPTTFPSAWSQITGIPETFAPAGHVHTISDITNLQAALDAKAAATHTHPVSSLTGATAAGQVPMYDGSTVVWSVPSGGGTGGTVTPASDTVAGIVEFATVAETLTGTATNLAVTPAGVGAVAVTKPNLNQAFVAIDADGVPYFDPGMDFTDAVPLYEDEDGVPYLNAAIPWTPTTGSGGTGGTISWNNITNVPTTFPPSTHTHTAGQITGGTNGYVLTSNGTVGTWAPATGGGTGATVSPASDTVAGIVELATNAEAIAGTDVVRAITPAADKAALDSRFNSFAPSWGSISGKPVYTWGPGSNNNGNKYRRLFTINGNGNLGGAYVTFILSGMGDYGNSRKGTVLVHFSQRGDNSVTLKIWGFDTDASNGHEFYTRQVTTSNLDTFELWVRTAPFSFDHTLTILSQSSQNTNSVAMNMDSDTTTAPSGLSAVYSITDMDDIVDGRLGKTMTNTNGFNFDTTTDSGWYAGYNATKSPMGDTGGYMTQVLGPDANNLVQMAHRTTAGNLRSFKREKLAGAWQPWRGMDGEVHNVLDYGAKGDAVYFSNAVMSTGSTTVTVSGANFTSADIGKVALAGARVTTITAVNSSTSVTLGATPTSTDLDWYSAPETAAPSGYHYVNTEGASLSYFLYGTDDTAAIQRALDDSGSGGTVLIPGQHEYIITSELHMSKRTYLKAGRAIIRKVGWTTNMIDNNSDGSSGYNANSNCIIEGGVWDSMAHHADRGINGITLAHCHDMIIKDAIFKNFGGSHAIEFDGVKSAKILNCAFLGYRAIRIIQGTSTRDRQYVEAIQIDYGGTSDKDSCTDILVEGCTFSDSDEMPGSYWGKALGSHTIYGVTAPTSPKFHEYIKFVNNTVYGARWNGIRALMWKNTLIANNYFMNCGLNYLDSNRQGSMTTETILVDTAYDAQTTNGSGNGSATSGIVIVGNTIRDGKGSGSEAAGISVHGSTSGGTQVNVSGVVIANNLIMGSAGNAVFTQYVNNATITGNNAVSAGASAYYHNDGSYVSLKNNTAVDTSGSGIWYNAITEGSIVGNQVTSPSSNGVLVAGGSNDCLVHSNFVHGAASGAASGSATSAYQVSGTSNYVSLMNNVARPGGSGWTAPANGRGGIYVTNTCTGTWHYGNDVRTLGISISGGVIATDATPNRA